MKKVPLLFVLLFTIPSAFGQENGFPFGRVSLDELNMQTYDKDTAAVALILNEFGEAYLADSDPYNLVFIYHAKIKILKKDGLKYADIEVPLYKSDGSRFEFLRDVKAKSFRLENGVIRESTLDTKNIFTQNLNQNYDLRKFAIPNAQVGAVIEFQYTLESPYKFNFRTWTFQADIPKLRSEYWPKIPGNYIYNMSLKGFLKMTKNENELIKDCFRIGGGSADCVRYKFGMTNIPAFREEEYMTARSNFVSAVNFELSELRKFDGTVDKFTKEWKDADIEFKRDKNFGMQLRRAKEIEEQIEPLIAGEVDPLAKAKKVYDFIKSRYQWDERYGMWCEFGIKKAFEQKKGNIADINLSLVAALRHAGLNADPMILSTRANGLPIEIHPVLSDFNYVIAKVNIGDKVFLADATDDFFPFGILPERCLNGKGRVIGEEDSYWYELMPADRAKQISVFTLKLEADGMMHGTLQTTFMGYDAVNQRKKLASFTGQKEYITDLAGNFRGISITDFDLKNVDELDQPLIQTLHVEIQAFDAQQKNFLFNPFIMKVWDVNPFKSNERSYPVDFGCPVSIVTLFNLEYPASFELASAPEPAGLVLPKAGGQFIFEIHKNENKLSLNNSLTLNKTVYSSAEYHYLKELFARIIQIQNTDLLFKSKT